MNTKQIGSEAESAAAKYLIDKGFKVVDRNYKNRFCEIDIVARDKLNIVFVEVKFRKNQKFGSGYEYVNETKKKRLIRAARYWLSENSSSEFANMQPRIDVVSIENSGGITHIENAVESID